MLLFLIPDLTTSVSEAAHWAPPSSHSRTASPLKITTNSGTGSRMMRRPKPGSKITNLLSQNTVLVVWSHHATEHAGYLPWEKPLLVPAEKWGGLTVFPSDYNCCGSCNVLQRGRGSKHFLINFHFFFLFFLIQKRTAVGYYMGWRSSFPPINLDIDK